ncbi:hypothetical protein [Microbispora bryophytorum]|uniref:hypothetical protein n=1 Tax=Microbispora bryophytorum TaxID=1460882 RepID=UPI0033E534D2
MAFPIDPLDVTVELLIDGVWTDITTDVLVRDGITITRGRRDEGVQTDPSRCSLSIKNTGGKYSPRNPNSIYYGKIGRNTQIRIKVDGEVRFHGEVSSWPPKWDVSGNDVWTPIEAAGITRRLGQGSTVLSSTMYRGLTYPEATDTPVAYWPCEDAKGSTALASATPGGSPMRIKGAPTLAQFGDFVASAPIPLLSDSEWTGTVPTYTVTGETQVRFLLHVPSTGTVNNQTIIRIRTQGTAKLWHLNYGTGGALQLQAFAGDNGGGVLDTGMVSFDIDGKLLRVSIELTENGSNIDWAVATLEVGQEVGAVYFGTLNSYSVGPISQIIVSPEGGIDDVAIGHISVQSAVTTLFDLAGQLAGWHSEPAGRRIERLCEEEGIPFTSVGDLDDTEPLGTQRSATLMELLIDAAQADDGILYEPRDEFGLAYRTRSGMYNQSATAELDYSDGHLSPPLEPIDDDQGVVNDVTVSRYDGSSARYTKDSGPLSVSDPPNGVGRYDDSITLNVRDDARLADQASWRIHVGTVDEARYPTITVSMSNSEIQSNSTVKNGLIDLDIGDRITIDSLPEWIPPGLISQLALGFTETLEPYVWQIDVNCVPESPYEVAVYGTDRYGTDYSTLSSSSTSSTTSLLVATSKGPLWTTASGDLPLDIVIDGEQIRVNSISGSSSPQTFSVTRSRNGVVKSHSSGAKVTLFKPAIRAL